jgi:molecular chaperone DnaK
MENAETGKRTLTQTSPVSIIGDRQLNECEISRADFDDATSDLLFETQQLLEQVLDDAANERGIPRDKIRVLLAGGSTRMPMVEEMIAKVAGQPPLKHGNPDLLVSMGAAYWAYVNPVAGTDGAPATPAKSITVKTKDEQGGISDQEVFLGVQGRTHYAVGIECSRVDDQGNKERYISVILPKGSKYGPDGDCEREFYKTEDNMREVQIILYKCPEDTEDISEGVDMASFRIGPLPEGGKKGEKVRVKLGHDDNGILRGEAEDLTTGKKVDIEVERSKIESA